MLSSCSVFLCQQETSADDGFGGGTAQVTGGKKGKTLKEIQGPVVYFYLFQEISVVLLLADAFIQITTSSQYCIIGQNLRSFSKLTS